jgi:hypothetical protein
MNNEIKLNQKVMIPVELTTDPVNKQGQWGVVIGVYKSIGEVVVKFPDHVIGHYCDYVFSVCNSVVPKSLSKVIESVGEKFKVKFVIDLKQDNLLNVSLPYVSINAKEEEQKAIEIMCDLQSVLKTNFKCEDDELSLGKNAYSPNGPKVAGNLFFVGEFPTVVKKTGITKIDVVEISADGDVAIARDNGVYYVRHIDGISQYSGAEIEEIYGKDTLDELKTYLWE